MTHLLLALAALLGLVVGVFTTLVLLNRGQRARDLRHLELICNYLRREGCGDAAGRLEARLAEKGVE